MRKFLITIFRISLFSTFNKLYYYRDSSSCCTRPPTLYLSRSTTSSCCSPSTRRRTRSSCSGRCACVRSTHMLSMLRENKFAFIQAEDELAAMGMTIGANWNGARAFTATSGPGVSLMSEFIGLAYFAEVPAVIFNVQRGTYTSK